MGTVEAMQVGNDYDEFLKTNAFTLDYSGIDLQSANNHGNMAVLINSYQGCLISLMMNKALSPNNLQVSRATYTIRTHLNMMSESTTEFYSIGLYVKNISYSSYADIKTNYRAPCQMMPYYWHPYLKVNFYLDFVDNYYQAVFTCFPYTTLPQTACDTNFDSAGNPGFRVKNLRYHDTGTYGQLGMIGKFTYYGGWAYTAQDRYYYNEYCCYWYTYWHVTEIYRYDFSGSNCGNYDVVQGSQIFTSTTQNTRYRINQLVTITYFYSLSSN